VSSWLEEQAIENAIYIVRRLSETECTVSLAPDNSILIQNHAKEADKQFKEERRPVVDLSSLDESIKYVN
jgi:hypothetical protein